MAKDIKSKPWFKIGETAYKKIGIQSNSESPLRKFLLEGSEDNLKYLVNYYDMIGRAQVSQKTSEGQKLRDLSNGIINVEDFVASEEIDMLQSYDSTINFREDDTDLEFFPIAPPIFNRLAGEFDKKHLKFNARAVNPEATNQIIQERNDKLLSLLQESIQKVLERQQVNPEELQAKVAEELKRASKDYRTEIEEWCNHFMNICEQQFNLRHVERELFKENLINAEPYIHINYQDNHFYPEIWNMEDVFYIKSKLAQDASDYTMIGKYSYIDFNTILNKYSLSDEQVETLSKWTEYFQGAFTSKAGFVQNGQHFFEGTNTKIQESSQNHLTAQNILNSQEHSASGNVGNNRLVRETYMYFLAPQKVGLLTTIVNDKPYTVEVDANFKVTIKPEYSHTKKEKKYLVYGEHLEWTYINVLYRCVKLDMSFSSSSYYAGGVTKDSSGNEFKPIYIFLGRHDIQYQHKNLRYGVRIPVHGGPSVSPSIIKRTAPWQKFYNYLWNRNKQLLSTEIGKFLLINQNILPQNSMDQSWQENTLLKSFLSARDISLMPTDLSLTNTGVLQAGGGIGQTIDLTKTSEVIEKAQLASLIKQECYDSLGLNPTFMAHTSEYQSAKSVSMGNDQTITQLQPLYTKHYDIMKQAWATILETGLYLTSKGELRNLSYLNSDGQRIIFNLMDETPLLTELNIYPESDPNDIIDLETIKQIIISNNTLGLDALGVSDLVFAKNPTEVKSVLKEGIKQKEEAENRQRQHEQEMQDKQIQANDQAMKIQMDNDNRNAQLDRESKLEYARIDALKFAKADLDVLSDEIKEMTEYNMQMEENSQKRYEFDVKSKLEELKLNNSIKQNDDTVSLQERMHLKELDIREKELAETKRRNSIMSKGKSK